MLRQGFVVGRRANYESALSIAADRDFDLLELNMEHGFGHRTIDAGRVGELARDHGVDLVVHLPYRLDPGSPHDHVREGASRELEAALDAAATMNAERAVLHATSNVHPESWDHETVREYIYDTVRRVDERAADLGITACVENLKTPFFDASDFPSLFEQTDAAGCLDTGHAAVTGQDGAAQATLLREHGDRFEHVHLNETRSLEDDEHLPVGLGFVDFEPIASAIVETGWSGTCTHELWPYRPDYATESKRQFDRLLDE